MNKNIFTEFYIIGKVEQHNKKLKNFLDFIYNNENIKYNEVLNSSFFLSESIDSFFVKLLPLKTIPYNAEKLKTYYKPTGEFQFQSLIYESDKEYMCFLKTLSELSENEIFYSIYRRENDIIPIIQIINKEGIKKIDFIESPEEYKEYWDTIFKNNWKKAKKAVKKQLVFNEKIDNFYLKGSTK